MIIVVKIYISGLVLLVSAIALNGMASVLGLTSWYDYLKNRKKQAFSSLLWLYIAYPLGLGAVMYAVYLALFSK